MDNFLKTLNKNDIINKIFLILKNKKNNDINLESDFGPLHKLLDFKYELYEFYYRSIISDMEMKKIKELLNIKWKEAFNISFEEYNTNLNRFNKEYFVKYDYDDNIDEVQKLKTILSDVVCNNDKLDYFISTVAKIKVDDRSILKTEREKLNLKTEREKLKKQLENFDEVLSKIEDTISNTEMLYKTDIKISTLLIDEIKDIIEAIKNAKIVLSDAKTTKDYITSIMEKQKITLDYVKQLINIVSEQIQYINDAIDQIDNKKILYDSKVNKLPPAIDVVADDANEIVKKFLIDQSNLLGYTLSSNHDKNNFLNTPYIIQLNNLLINFYKKKTFDETEIDLLKNNEEIINYIPQDVYNKLINDFIALLKSLPSSSTTSKYLKYKKKYFLLKKEYPHFLT